MTPLVSRIPVSVRRLRALRSIEAVGREAVALARQAVLLHRDVTVVMPKARPGDDVVVFVHGLFATAGMLRPLREQIELHTGARTATFTYAPGPSIERIAERLSELVRALPQAVRIHLVGHSVGGLVSRWFVQELGGDPRIVQTISLGTPFNGTSRARLFPAPVGRDIVPESFLLCRLRRGASAGVPHFSIAGADDQIVPRGALFNVGEGIVIDGCGHNGLIYHPRTLNSVLGKVRAVQAAAALSDVLSHVG
jgi:triacylglycerol lipase